MLKPVMKLYKKLCLMEHIDVFYVSPTRGMVMHTIHSFKPLPFNDKFFIRVLVDFKKEEASGPATLSILVGFDFFKDEDGEEAIPTAMKQQLIEMVSSEENLKWGREGITYNLE